MDAFERYDINSLVSLLREDAMMSMPPFDFWLAGPAEMRRWFSRPGLSDAAARAWWRPRPTAARRSVPTAKTRTAGSVPWAIQIIEISGDRITGHHNFVDPSLFSAFGLPDRLP